MTHIKATPSYFSKISPITKAAANLSQMKWVILGGEALVKSNVQQWLENNPEHIIVNEYGPTEATVATVAFKCTKSNIASLDRIPIGQVAYNTEAYILNVDGMLAGVGELGELYLAGESVAQGYLNQSELTNERFIANTISKKYKYLYRTGDLTRLLADGNIDYLGRMDEQIKINGYRIEPNEIASILSEHPKIEQASILFINEEETVLAVYYVPSEAIKEEEILEYLYQRLPYYMIPKYIYEVDAIPLTPNEKLDKVKLTSVKAHLDCKFKHNFNSPLEKKLAVLFAEVLGLNSVAPLANFFHLGGDSMVATRLVVKIKAELKKDIAIVDVFKYPCIRFLALHLQNLANLSSQDQINRLTNVQRFKPNKVSHAQKRLWIMNEFEPNSSLYNIFGAWKLTGEIDNEALKNAVEKLVDRHESLRTIFVGGDLIEPKQMVLKKVAINQIYKFIELKDDQENQLEEFIKQEANLPFDLSAGPLLRVRLIKIGKDYYFSLCIHHIICDGWSLHIILDEISACYTSNAAQEEALPIQYIDYSEFSNHYIETSQQATDQLNQWINQLHNLPSLSLREESVSCEPRYEGERVFFPVSLEQSNKVKNLARLFNCTPFTILLTIYYVLLARYFRQNDFAIGVLASGRHHSQIQDIVGFFVNLLPIRIKLSALDTSENLIAKVAEALITAFEHQDIPFDLIVEKLHPQRKIGVNPLCQVLFAYQNYEHGAFELGGFPCKRIFSDNEDLLFSDYGSSKFDLSLLMQEKNGVLEGLIEFNSEKVSNRFVSSMIKHFLNIIDIFPDNLTTNVNKIPLFSKQEITKILASTPEMLSSELENLYEAFLIQAKRHPTRKALVFQNKIITYANLIEKVDHLANNLAREGVQSKQPVAVLLGRGADLVISLLAILKLGAIYVPVDSFSNPHDRIAAIIQDCQAELVLINQESAHYINLINKLKIKIFDLDSAVNTPSSVLIVSPCANDAAYIIYTSGSTGRPKGVVQTHKTLLNLIKHQGSAEEVCLKRMTAFAAVGFDVSLQEIFYALLTGSELHIITEEAKQNLVDSIDYIFVNQITHIFLPTALLEYFCYEALYIEKKFTHLQTIFVAGEQLKITQTIRSFFIKHSHIRLINQYGPTETHVVTECCLEGGATTWPAIPTIGKPILNTKALVLDEHR
ncbi:MAG TPA: condensation domain-containing protein, partial [Coxiellaceae bacterium]|nr:condensation domain-containing protein [Coxiellaceae bacterium]